jgi:hypothetical protein
VDINNPFETFEKYAFRLEALPQYIVSEEWDSFDYFLATGLVRHSDSSWPELIKKNVAAGKKMERLRLFSQKLTDYERYETQSYRGPGVGERIKVALRNDFVEKYLYDFWFFDDKWIAQVNYEADGTFINFDVRPATNDEIEMFKYWHSIYETATPLRQVPFVSNTADDTHCLQAAYMSIAQYFNPYFAIPMDEWSVLTGYEEGKGTWANAGLVWFKEHGYEVKHTELFDYDAFMNDPKGYMISLNGKEAGEWGYANTNVPAEIERMKRLLGFDIIEQREPTMNDIKQYINEGYLVRLTINCQKLDNEDGYVGHAVVITGYNDTYITLHDPGLPAIPNRQVTFEQLQAAWDDQAKELDAIRLS